MKEQNLYRVFYGDGDSAVFTNITDIFDDASNDAQFIWSTNVILDNEVIVRKIVQ